MLWKRNNFCSLCNKSYAVSFSMLDLNCFFSFQGWVSTLLIKETVSLLFWLGLFNNKRAYRNYRGGTVTAKAPSWQGLQTSQRGQWQLSAPAVLSGVAWFPLQMIFTLSRLQILETMAEKRKCPGRFASDKEDIESMQGGTSSGVPEFVCFSPPYF